MSKRAFLISTAVGLASSLAIAALLIYSLRAGVAPVTIPIFALVLGPALAAAAMVATCSAVAPPPHPQPLMRAVELRTPQTLDDAIETAV